MLVIQTLLSVFLIWSVIIAILGTIYQRKKNISETVRQNHFGIIICAHNEETVIDQLLSCLDAQVYPATHRQVFLLADHCTDQTAQVGKRHPAVTVWERNEGERSGKGAMLNWGLEQIHRYYPDTFEVLLVFDADNIVQKDFLTLINQAFCSGADIITGRRIAQNPYDSLVSQWYTLYWCVINALYNRPRYNLGLSSMISGTGFAFKVSLLEGQGWNTISMSEDIEFSVQQCLKGNHVDFIEEAPFYDEQPTSFKVMVTQLRRWCSGDYQIVSHYLKPWWKRFKANPSCLLFDLFMAVGFCVIVGLVALFYIILAGWMFTQGFFLTLLLPAVIFLYSATCLVGLVAALQDGWNPKKLWSGLLTFPIFYSVFSLVSLFAFFFPTKKWVNIVHKGASDEDITDMRMGR